MGERRETKKRETRERISDVATKLFVARGFDAVTLDEIAVAAKVSKMTVFNYFARKEELMLDREDDLLLMPFREAIRDRPKGQSPIDAVRGRLARMRAQDHSLTRVDPRTLGWWRVVAESPALKARLHELGDEAALGLAIAIGGPKPDGRARLVAGMIVLTLRTAREEAIRILEQGGSAKKANAELRALTDRGFEAALAMTAQRKTA